MHRTQLQLTTEPHNQVYGTILSHVMECWGRLAEKVETELVENLRGTDYQIFWRLHYYWLPDDPESERTPQYQPLGRCQVAILDDTGSVVASFLQEVALYKNFCEPPYRWCFDLLDEYFTEEFLSEDEVLRTIVEALKLPVS